MVPTDAGATSPSLAPASAVRPGSKASASGTSRIDMEGPTLQLRACLGDGWLEYKTAIKDFVLGKLNHSELQWVIGPLILGTGQEGQKKSTDPAKSTRLHNAFLFSIFANLYRDQPDGEVAGWVVDTTDRHAGKSGGVGGNRDRGEEITKKEVMGLSARERRRIKNLIDVLPPIETRGWDEAVDYHNALTVKPPVEHNVPMSAGGVSRVSYELEARKRFAQPLAQETQEIPSQSEVQARLEPISHCEGVTGTSPNTVQACAELVEQGLEVYVKELMGSLMTYAWSGSDGCIKPAKRRKLNSAEPPGNSPIDMRDVRLALDHNEPYLRRDPFMAETCQIKAPPRHKETANGRRQSTRMDAGNQEDTSWPGGGKRSREDLRRLLDGCLGA